MRPESERTRVHRLLGPDALVVTYPSGDLLSHVALTVVFALFAAISLGYPPLAALAGVGAGVQCWRWARGKVAYGVGPEGIYLGAAYQRDPELIRWDDIVAVDVTYDPALEPLDFAVSTRRGRARVREPADWQLDPGALANAVQRHGSLIIGYRDRIPPPRWSDRLNTWLTRT